VPDKESRAKIDTAIEAIRQRLKDLDAEVGRIEADPRAKTATAALTAIRQQVKDLDAAVQRIQEARAANTDRAEGLTG